jgi:hypothetical protein
MSDKEKDLRDISQAIMKTYHEKMHEYLNSKPEGSLTDADVVVMIMNLTISISTNIYYSLKQVLPTTPLDFDFMKAKLSNSLIDCFEKIKEFNPKERMMPLTVEQITQIREKGFVMVTMPDGSERRVTEDDILIKKEDVDKLVNEAKNATNTPKLILPSHNVVSRR